MPRNLVLCFDGTNNEFGPENTNVIRLVQVLERDPDRQKLYYDPGVGTLPRPEMSKFREKLSRVPGLAVGAGLRENVEEAYSYLVDEWEPGDQVFVFGFSRGAYTARVLTGMLHLMGLIPRGNHNMLPYAMELFRAVRNEPEGMSKYWKLCHDFRQTFARPAFDGDNARHFIVRFVGVWDTVSSVGWVWDPTHYKFTASNPSITTLRHALAVDERRWFFRQNQFKAGPGQDVVEMWFAGVHSDVGGGYPESEGGLWRISFRWMLREGCAAGLRYDRTRLHQVLSATPLRTRPWLQPQHESLEGGWKIAEYVPKWRWSPKTRSNRLRLGLGRHRFIPKGSRVHSSVLKRIRASEYTPVNLSQAFIARVRGLSQVPPWLETDDEV